MTRLLPLHRPCHVPMLHRSLTLLAAVAVTVALSGCSDDECTLTCPTGQACVVDNGLELCRDTCGGVTCEAGATCVDNVCVVDQTCSPECSAGTHCVYGSCIENYTSSNACDPLRECRRACNNGADSIPRCAAACDDDTAASCQSLTDALATCEASNDCPAGNIGPYTDCCEAEFCAAFPSHPGCGNVLPCVECAEDCGSDAACFNTCVEGEPACSTCLQPYFECLDDGGECLTEFCTCVPDTACN